MKASTALQACANRCSSLAHFMAWRTDAADSCGIMRAVSAADNAVPCANIPAYTIKSPLLGRGSRPSMIQLK